MLLLIAAIAASREYSAYAKRRIDQYDGFIELFSYAEGMISRFLSYGEALWRGFENGALEACGFLPALREGTPPIEAFEKCEGRLSLPREAKDKIKAFLSSMGRSYKDGELATLSAFRTELQSERKRQEEDLDKNVKIARALLLGGALAVFILII